MPLWVIFFFISYFLEKGKCLLFHFVLLRLYQSGTESTDLADWPQAAGNWVYEALEDSKLGPVSYWP